MLYQYSHRLGAYAPGLDPDAKAYIAAVETALSSSISGDQKNAINTFFKTGKSAGWYSSIKRLYLPIWADAAANAIDMISRTSGTFTASGVTHASGYVQGDGASGYFDTATSPPAVGLSGGSCAIFILESTQATAGFSGYRIDVSGSNLLIGNASGNSYGAAPFSGSAISVGDSDRRGIRIMSCAATNARFFGKLTTAAGWQILGSNTTTDNTELPVGNVFFMARNYPAVATDSFMNSRFGAFGLATGVSQEAAGLFAASLKTLWETASGLTLP